jgi:nitroimidazol reductase NimA-like FMN-containing flavoprotein (pyridoxamine 5'-phosphate oxidase superfamily)
MRKADREIKALEEIESIIRSAPVCRIGFSENDIPYIVPVNFGYRDRCLYFHSAPEGRKMDILKRNNRVCFEIDMASELIQGETPCKWDMKYISIMGNGRASLVHDPAEKSRALNIIMAQYQGDPYEYSEGDLEKVAVVKIEIESMTGKRSGY